MSATEKELVKRIKKLKKYDNAYYNTDSPLITDRKYDAFREETENLYEKADFKSKEIEKYFNGVRVKVRESKRSETLPIILGSLKKAKNDSNSMDNFLKNALKASISLSSQIKDKKVREHYKSQVSYNISPKLDGLTFLLHYENGKLVKAYSGGDGVKGQNKKQHAKLLVQKGIIPKAISHKNPRYIIGEIVCSKKKFEGVVRKQKKAKEKIIYNEVRNAASGWVNADEPPELLSKAISFIAYDIKTPDGDLGITKNIKELDLGASKKANKINTLATLKKWGFKTYTGTEFHQVVTAVDYSDAFSKLLNGLLEKIDKFEYPLDGIVIEVSDSHIRHHMGTSRNGTPKFAIAYKVSADSAISSGKGTKTKVTAIVPSTSKVGALKPTLHYKPIKIGSATFSKATGNNYAYLLSKGIGIGTEISVVKAGDVIPKAYFADTKKAKEKDIFPAKCSCGAKAIKITSESGKILPDLYCKLGTECPDAKYEQLAFAIKATKITGLGAKNIRKLYDLGYTDIIELILAATNKKEAKKILSVEGFGKSMLQTLAVGLPANLRQMALPDILLMSNVFTRPGLSLARASFVDAESLIKRASKKGHIDKQKCKEILGEEKGKLLHSNFKKWLTFYKSFLKVTGGYTKF